MAERAEVGTVVSLARYPVKGMAGEECEELRLGWQGFAGDRRFAFLERGSRSGLPWLSPRRWPLLARYAARLVNDDEPPVVFAPDGWSGVIWSEELRERLERGSRKPLQVVQLYRGAFDAMPVALISLASIAAVAEEYGQPLDPERFRGNIVVNGDGRAYPEEKWLGKTIGFGVERDAPRLKIVRKDPRCSVVNIDPAAGTVDPNVLKAVVRLRRNMLGVYGVVVRPGLVKMGDPIWLG